MPHTDNIQEKLRQARTNYDEMMETIAPFLPKIENTEPFKPEIWIQEDSVSALCDFD